MFIISQILEEAYKRYKWQKEDKNMLSFSFQNIFQSRIWVSHSSSYESCHLLAHWCLSRLIFDPEDESDTFLRNLCSCTDHTALYPSRWQLSRFRQFHMWLCSMLAIEQLCIVSHDCYYHFSCSLFRSLTRRLPHDSLLCYSSFRCLTSFVTWLPFLLPSIPFLDSQLGTRLPLLLLIILLLDSSLGTWLSSLLFYSATLHAFAWLAA
jgi:hypothetical protein